MLGRLGDGDGTSEEGEEGWGSGEVTYVQFEEERLVKGEGIMGRAMGRSEQDGQERA